MPTQRWLMKTEPDAFSIDDLARVGVEPWTAVRNFQARNHMKAMRIGDLALFYHSSAEPSGVAGVCEIAREAYPDHSAWRVDGDYFDAKSTPEKPLWFMVDVRFVRKLPRLVPLPELRAIPELASMLLFRASRLSVQPVEPKHFELILRIAEKPAPGVATTTKPSPRAAKPARARTQSKAASAKRR